MAYLKAEFGPAKDKAKNVELAGKLPTKCRCHQKGCAVGYHKEGCTFKPDRLWAALRMNAHYRASVDAQLRRTTLWHRIARRVGASVHWHARVAPGQASARALADWQYDERTMSVTMSNDERTLSGAVGGQLPKQGAPGGRHPVVYWCHFMRR